MPGWLIPRQFTCVDCRTTYAAVTPRSKRCKACQYKHVLLTNKIKRHKGPFVFNCGDCGVEVVSKHPLQRHCADCMRPHALWMEKLNNRKWAPIKRKPPRTIQCTDCGALVSNAMPTQKRCPGCQVLRAGKTTKPWRPLRKLGKPINCEQCNAPVVRMNVRRRLCDECTYKYRLRQTEEYRRRIKRDPVAYAYLRARLEKYRREWRSEMKKLINNPELIERAVMQRLGDLGMGEENGNGFGT